MKICKLLPLSAVFALLLIGCIDSGSVAVVDDSSAADSAYPPVPLKYLVGYWGEAESAIVKDQLEKVGFAVEIEMTADYGAYLEKINVGDFDIATSGWTTVTGNPDYAVRSLFTPDGDYNKSGLDDPRITELIIKAGSQTPENYVATYSEFEQLMMDEAYIAPLYSKDKNQAYNSGVLLTGPENVRFSKSRSGVWEKIDYNDTSLRLTRTVYYRKTSPKLASYLNIAANTGSVNDINTNIYSRLVNLTDNDVVEAKGSLSHQFAIADGNREYYFLLNDNINFSVLRDGEVIDSGLLVGVEDVIAHLNLAKNKDSIPNHVTYTLFQSIENVQAVTSIDELETTKVADGRSILEVFQDAVDIPVAALTAVDTEVSNADGLYQVAKITTSEPFPQVLNFLAHQSGGITPKEMVAASIAAAPADATAISYGNTSDTQPNGNYRDGILMGSGPYLPVYKDDTEMIMHKNPGYKPGTEFEPRVLSFGFKFIPDNQAAVNSLINGEIDIFYAVPDISIDKIAEQPDLEISIIRSNATSYLDFNMNREYDRVTLDKNIRMAVLYAIDQQNYIDIVAHGHAVNIATTVTPLINHLPGYVPVEKPTDPEKAREFLRLYHESLN